MYPTAQQYIDLLTKEGMKDALASKWGVELVYDAFDNPIFHIGNNGIVFKFRELKTREYRAYKFFTKDLCELDKRYKDTISVLNGMNSPFIPRMKFRDGIVNIVTNDGKAGKFPVLIMDWIEGDTLNQYIHRVKSSPCKLAELFCKFMQLASWLISNNLIHRDLHPENLMVDSSGNLLLVDFDSFQLPTKPIYHVDRKECDDFYHPFAHYIGHPSYYDDDFSIILLALSLRAILIDPNLLGEYSGEGPILLSHEDLKDISESNKLKNIFPSLDPILDELYGIFMRCYNEFVLPKAEFLRLVKKCEQPTYLNTSPTRREKKFAFKDEFGTTYSADGLKLIEFDGFSYGYDQKTFEPKPNCRTICDNAFRYNSAYERKVIIPETICQIGINALPKCEIENHSPYFKVENGSVFTHDRARLLNIFNCSCSLYEVPSETHIIDDGAIPSEAAPYYVKIHNSEIQLDPCDSVIIVKTEEDQAKLIANGVREEQIYVGEVLLDAHDVLYSEDGEKLLCFPRESRLRSYEIIEKCKIIAPNAFPNIPDPDDDGWMNYIGNDLLMITFPRNLKSIEDYSLLGMTDLKVARYNKADEENVFHLLDTYQDAFKSSFRQRVIMIPDCHYTQWTNEDFDGCIKDSLHVQYSSDGAKLIGNMPGEKGLYMVHQNCRVICDGAFVNSNFDQIILPESVEAIGAFAFEDSDMKEVIINLGVKAIENNAFKGCKHLKYVVLPSGLFYTGDGLFLGCRSLRYIVIPSTLLRFDFDSLPNTISRIYIEEGSIFFNELYEDERFSHKLRPFTSTTVLPNEFDNAIEVDNVLYSADKKRLLSINGEVEVLNIPEGTETICDEAFNDLTNSRNEGRLRELILPSSLKEIGRNAFCGSINIIVNNSPKFICKDEMLLSNDGRILYYYYGDCDGEFNFDNEIYHIWSGAFISRKIKSVNYGRSIYEVDDNPFLDVYSDEYSGRGIVFKNEHYGNYRANEDCFYSPRYWGKEPKLIGYYGSSSVVDLRGMDLGQIQKYAFFGRLVEKIYLPSSIKFIHRQAFEWCFELREIIVDKGQSSRFKLMLPTSLGKYVIEEEYRQKEAGPQDNDLPF